MKKKSIDIKSLIEAFEKLAELNDSERMDVYKNLRTVKPSALSNSVDVFDMNIPIEKLAILHDGYIGLNPPVLFLSHSHIDKPIVRKIGKRLEKKGLTVWLDEAEIRFGDSLIQKLRDAIDRVDLVLAFLSEASVESEWVRKELEIATTQEISSRRVKVIPVMLERVNLPGFLEGKAYADFSSQSLINKNFPRLLNSVNSHMKEK